MSNLALFDVSWPSAEQAKAAAAPRRDIPLGTAAWHQFDEVDRPTIRPGDLWLSRLPTGEPVGFRDDRHVLICSGTRGGKGVSVIIPNLCLWPGSAVVIDPKGENAMVTARRRGGGSTFCRGMGQRVRILDPFGEVRTVFDDFADLKVRFNPLDLINTKSEESVDHAARIAEALVVAESSSDPFWEESAKALIKALILHVASWKDYLPKERNLVTVRHLLMAGDEEARKLALLTSKKKSAPSGLALLFGAMQRNPAFQGAVADAGAHFANLEKSASRSLAGVFQVACTNTDFITSPPMQRCLAKSDFALEELKTGPEGVSLYLCLPQRYMETHFRWLRMMTTLTITEMERVKRKPACGHPVLMVLDEFAALRRMRVLENAAAQIAGFGVKLMFVVQTLAQLKDIYKDNWETLVANAGVKLFFGNDDNFTREYVSRLIGDCEVIRTTHNASSTQGTSSSTARGETLGASTSHAIGTSSGLSFSDGRVSFSSGRSVTATIGESWSNTLTHTAGASESRSRGFGESVHKRPLLTPDEVGRVFGDRDRPAALALIAGFQPLALKRIHYFRDASFAGLFDLHADHARPLTITELTQKQRDESERARIAAAKALAERTHREEKEREAREEAQAKQDALDRYHARIAESIRKDKAREEERYALYRKIYRHIRRAGFVLAAAIALKLLGPKIVSLLLILWRAAF